MVISFRENKEVDRV